MANDPKDPASDQEPASDSPESGVDAETEIGSENEVAAEAMEVPSDSLSAETVSKDEEEETGVTDAVSEAGEDEVQPAPDAETPDVVASEAEEASAEPDEGSAAVDGPEEGAEPDQIPDDAYGDDEPVVSALVPPPVMEEPRRRGLSVVIGGVIAAVLGAIAMYLAQDQGWLNIGGPDPEMIARIDALETALSEARGAVDTAEAEIAELKAAAPELARVSDVLETVVTDATAMGENVTGNTEALSTLTARLDDTDTRLEKVAVEQIPEAELPQAISEAYDAKLGDLLATIDGRFEAMQAALAEEVAAMEGVVDDRVNDIDAAEAAAEAELRANAALAALAQMKIALQDGRPFADELTELSANSDVEIPETLAASAPDGIPTASSLAESFPEFARAALSASVQVEREEGSIGGMQAFLQSQFGARSLTPQEGDGADAVLSRVEAAIIAGDLDTALAEVSALPDEGQAALADWTELAKARKAALDAADELVANLENS
ncbi:MAG: hypothetical protein AAF748_13435 [Pseudomonadota bacterium]